MTPFSIIIVLSLVFLPFTSHAEDLDKGPLELITAAEAATPDLPSSESYFEISREGDDGPIIELNAPQIGNPAKSPLTIDVTFVQSKGKNIDLSTFKAEYQQFSVNPVYLANTGHECPAYRDRRGFLTPLYACLPYMSPRIAGRVSQIYHDRPHIKD